MNTNIKVGLIKMVIGIVVLLMAVLLTWLWFDVQWWKSVILFILYGWAFNMDHDSFMLLSRK